MTETSADAGPGRRQCVLVLGMHRSGTSAVTRVLSLLGAGLPRNLMGASGSNLAGHWEPKTIVEINDRLLHEGRSAWNDWRPFNPEAALSPAPLARYRREIETTIEGEYSGENLFVLKDPRISRLAPLYLDALATIGVGVKVVLVSRHPMEVAESLARRDGMPISDALLLWLRNDLDAEAATRGCDRLVLSYDALIDNSVSAIQRLQDFLGPTAHSGVDVAAARASLRGELRHHRAREIDCPALPEAARWATDALSAFQALEDNPYSPGPQSALDNLRSAMDHEVAIRGDRIAYVIEASHRSHSEIQDLLRQREVGTARIRELEAREAESAVRIGELEAKYAARIRELEEREAEIARKNSERYNQLSEEYLALTDECRQVTDEFWRYRRHSVTLFATSTRADFRPPDDVPKSLSPWRMIGLAKRLMVRRRLHDYLTILASPLFDSEYYLRVYPDVADRGFMPALHYLLHGSKEGRRPSEFIDPSEILEWFPELRPQEGNLVLGLIDLHHVKARKKR